jgi:hypothetical protein
MEPHDLGSHANVEVRETSREDGDLALEAPADATLDLGDVDVIEPMTPLPPSLGVRERRGRRERERHSSIPAEEHRVERAAREISRTVGSRPR